MKAKRQIEPSLNSVTMLDGTGGHVTLPIALIADRDSWSSCTPFHREALNEVFQVFVFQPAIAAIQVHDFHKVTVGPAGPGARSLRERSFSHRRGPGETASRCRRSTSV